MAARRATSVCLPVSTRSAVEFRRYDSRTPILTIRAGYSAALVTLTLPDRVEEGHVLFARQLARQAARYAMEVERLAGPARPDQAGPRGGGVMIPSTAYVNFRPDGPAQVDTSLRLTGSSRIQCSTYEDRPAILSVTDAHVSVSVTVPDSSKVTVDDLDVAVRLAEALADYIADLRRRRPAQNQAAADAA